MKFNILGPKLSNELSNKQNGMQTSFVATANERGCK